MPEILPKTPENQKNPNTQNENVRKHSNKSLYELSREERIKENLQRMQKLGIVDLSLKLKSIARPKRSPRQCLSDFKRPSPEMPSGPVRRSSRLQNVTPVTYSEEVCSKKGRRPEYNDVRLEEGSKPEVYTEEHEKLLGNTERSWTLFVDGCGADGKRIYDPVKGKTCHQCRQKTLGYRTHCSSCGMVQGQFCGDCLYMRYGEHVLEAIENPDWICPVCRGICNCSLCRQGKGWAPTGALYKKISRMGYKSVAHYLIQTRSEKNLEQNSDSTNQGSVKRSLAFPETESKESSPPRIGEDHVETTSPSEDKKDNDNLNLDNYQTSTKRSLPFSEIEAGSENVNSKEEHFGFPYPKLEDKTDYGFEGDRKTKLDDSVEVNDSSMLTALENSPNFNKKRAITEPNPDSIGSRLRQRRRKENGPDGMELAVVEIAAGNTSTEKEPEKAGEIHNTDYENSNIIKTEPAISPEPIQDSIARRLRQRRRESQDPQ